MFVRRLSAIFLLLLVAGCGKAKTVKETRLLMGTIVEVTVLHESSARAKRAIDEVFREGERVQSLLTVYEENSEVSLINRKAGIEEVKVSEEVFTVIESALVYSKLSGGAFEITVGPLLELWGFSGGQKRVPARSEIVKTPRVVDYRDLILNRKKRAVRLKRRGMRIDLGGIAKGYVVDSMVAVLRSEGIRGALVNAGGDIYALGSSRENNPWTIGIRDPYSPEGVIDTIKVRDQAVATSGDYEKFFIDNGKRFSHIIDPRTGYPASALASVTVIAETAMEADALATALFVLGEEEGKKIIDQFEDAEAIFFPHKEGSG